MKTLNQMLLDFNYEQNFKDDDFYVGKSNFYAFELINKWPKWEKNFLNINGEKFSGKSHLTDIFLKKFNGKNVNFYAMDNNTKMISYLKKLPFHIIKGDCFSKSLKLNPRVFDIAFSSGTFEHFKHPKRYIDNISKVSKKFIISCPAQSFYWKVGTFIRSFTDKEFQQFFDETI